MGTAHTSLAAMMRTICSTHSARAALLIPEKGGPRTVSYAQLWDHIRSYAAVLQSWGVNPGDTLILLSDNCAEWMIADYAAKTLGAISVGIYPSLPADQAQVIALDCKARLALCSSPEQTAKLSTLPGLTIHPLRGAESIAEKAESATLDDRTWNAGIDAVPFEAVTTLIYTSGTTGQPKGVMLTHAAFLTVCHDAAPYLEITHEDVFFSFLPISHVFERIASTLCFHQGSCMGLNKSLASMANDFESIKPTFMAAVPRFLEAFQDKVLDSVSKAPPIRQRLFQLYISQGVKKARGGFAPLHELLDGLVGSKIRARLGGQLTKVISGGAALPQSTAEFFMALNINILQGYGLTETTGGSCVNHRTRNKYWTVGEPIAVELKIESDGEVCFRGPTVMKGYFNNAEETAKVIDSDGWFHTGDIGEMEGKSLKITDRKKDILVLGNGKNIAPQPIENKIKQSRLISEVVVLGDGLDCCIALIYPNLEVLRQTLHLPDTEDIASSTVVRAALKKEIDLANKQLANFEMVKRFGIITEPLTVENRMLTPTLKVKRNEVKAHFAELIKTLSK